MDDQTPGERPLDDRQTGDQADVQASGQSSGQTGQASGRPDVTGGQVAQARGCWPFYDCYGECVETAQDELDRWDEVSESTREDILGLVPWIREQNWI